MNSKKDEIVLKLKKDEAYINTKSSSRIQYLEEFYMNRDLIDVCSTKPSKKYSSEVILLTAEDLLNNGANPNYKDEDGNSPIILAIKNKNSKSATKRKKDPEEFKKGWVTRKANGWKPSEETKKKQSEKLLGKAKPPRSDTHKINLGNSIKKLYEEGKLTTIPPNHSGTKWWNNGKQNKRSKDCPGEKWTLGKLK